MGDVKTVGRHRQSFIRDKLFFEAGVDKNRVKETSSAGWMINLGQPPMEVMGRDWHLRCTREPSLIG